MDTSFQSPVQKKDISTIKYSGYNESDNQVDKISYSKEQVDASSRSGTDSDEQVDPSSDPRVDTHITNRIQRLFISQIPVSLEPVVIGQDIFTSVQEISREDLPQESLKPLYTINSKDIVTGAARDSAQVESIFQTPSKAIHVKTRVNVEVFSPSRCSHSDFAKWLRNIDPFNTSIDVSLAQKRNWTSY